MVLCPRKAKEKAMVVDMEKERVMADPKEKGSTKENQKGSFDHGPHKKAPGGKARAKTRGGKLMVLQEDTRP